MDDLDLSDVDPLKWAEVRRRAEAVKRYLLLQNPSPEDRERFAASLDLGAQQFANLVRAWQVHRSAISLTPGWRRLAPSQSRRDGVTPEARRIAREVIRELGPTAPLCDLLGSTAARCAHAGIRPPSRGTMWLLAMEARGPCQVEEASGLLVARAYLRLPVEMVDAVVFPEVVVVAEFPTGRVIDLALVHTPGAFDGARSAAIIRSEAEHSPLPITAADREGAVLRRLLPGADITLVAPTEATRMLSSITGKRIGRIELSFRAPTVRPSTVMQSGKDRPPSVEDAEIALMMARQYHNAQSIRSES